MDAASVSRTPLLPSTQCAAQLRVVSFQKSQSAHPPVSACQSHLRAPDALGTQQKSG